MSRPLRPIDLGLTLPSMEPVEPPQAVTDSQLAQVGAVLRDCYYIALRAYTKSNRQAEHAVPEWDGGTDRWGHRHSSVWPRLATFVLGISADPMVFVHAQFQLADNPHRMPLPNQMMTEAAAAKYRQFAADQVPRLTREYRCHLNAVHDTVTPLVASGRWTTEEAMTYALCSKLDVQAPPLFRYCLAVQHGLPKVAARFREAALTEYVCQLAAYDAAWGAVVPEDLRVAGRQLRERLRV